MTGVAGAEYASYLQDIMKRLTKVAAGVCALVLSPSPIGAQEAAAPFAIQDRACLFLDDTFIAEQTGLRRTWHPGKPTGEVAIRATEPWEKWPHLFGSVFRDPKDGLFKMYYESAIFPSLNPPDSFTCLICYAQSKDGKAWVKPKLGLHDFKGSKENNIVLPHAELANVFLDPQARDPAARLKMFVFLQNHNPLKASGEVLASSGDGLNWELVGGFDKPPYANLDQGNFTDSHHFTWDPLGCRYFAYVRTFDKSHVAESKDGRRRAVGVTHCKELNKNWLPIAQVLAPDGRDDAKVAALSSDPAKPDWAEHYVMNVFTYGNHYLGLLSLLYFIDGSDFNGGGDLQLAFSHDGLKWHRQPERATLIGPSNAKGLFPTYTSTNGPMEVGDELWLYYSEANGAHPVAPFEKAVSQIRPAVWRKDGFVSLDAGDAGSLTTKPLAFEGRRLVLNLKAGAGGSVRVAVLDGGGKPLPGFGLKDCDPLKGDQVRSVVSWDGNSDLSSLQGRSVQLRLELFRSSVYSLRVSPD